MRIFILTLGTRGDFEPFWSLAQELQGRGHHVTLGTSGFHIQPDPSLHWLPIGDGDKAALLAILRGLAPNLTRGSAWCSTRSAGCCRSWLPGRRR